MSLDTLVVCLLARRGVGSWESLGAAPAGSVPQPVMGGGCVGERAAYFPCSKGNNLSSMTYKRKGTQRRSSNQQKATAMRWRRVQEEEAQQTHALSAPPAGPGSESAPPACTSLPPPPPSTSPPPPQASTSSTLAPPTQPAAVPTPPLPGTSASTASPPPTRETTFLIRQKLLSEVTRIEPAAPPESHEFLPVTVGQLDTLVQRQRCPVQSCRNRVTVTKSGDTLQTVCKKCHTVVSSASPPTYRKHGYDYSVLKLRQVYCSLVTGTGYVGVRLHQALVTGEKMNKASFFTYCRLLYEEMDVIYEEKMTKARAAVFKYYEEDLLRTPNEDGILDVDVSFDCTWMKRGHRSHAGLGFAVEVNTGIVVDLDVLYNFCYICSNKRPQKEHTCHKNFDGKAGAMEAEIAVRIWSRSSDYKMRFITFVGDGDSSAFNAVCKLNGGKGPYEVPVTKEECLNHVSKRMGTRLRKLKKEEFEIITTKTGRKMKRSILGGANMLTDNIIDKLSSYYGKAIRDNAHGNVRDMQHAIWASYYHLTATNEEHFHQCCPKGEDSWCFFNRANALQLPESEKDHKKKNLYLAKIPKEKLEYLRAVYKDLANPSLLNRCLKGATQNPNESIHSRVWNKCSKAKFCGRMRLHFIAKLTALENNFGYEYSNIITHLLGSEASIQETMRWLDKERVQHATPKVKRRKTEEKDDSYQPGEF